MPDCHLDFIFGLFRAGAALTQRYTKARRIYVMASSCPYFNAQKSSGKLGGRRGTGKGRELRENSITSRTKTSR